MSDDKRLEEEITERESEAGRKALQLCQLAGTMMLACKRLAAIQEQHHAEARLCAHPQRAATAKCQCGICRIALPDLSDEAISRLCDESNSAHAELSRLRAELSQARERDEVKRQALLWIKLISQSENPAEYDHLLHVDIPEAAQNALDGNSPVCLACSYLGARVYKYCADCLARQESAPPRPTE